MSSVCVNKRRACVFALILVCMCQQHGAQASPEVELTSRRLDEGAEFTLTWPQPVNVEVQSDPRELLLRFSRPLGDIQAGILVSEFPDLIQDVRYGYDSLLVRSTRKVSFEVARTARGLTARMTPAPADAPAPAPLGAVARDEEFRLDYLRALALLQSGELEQARTLLDKLHKDRPGDAEVIGSLALAETELGRWRQAVRLYDEGLQLRPGDPVLADARIRLLRQNGTYAKVQPTYIDYHNSNREVFAKASGKVVLPDGWAMLGGVESVYLDAEDIRRLNGDNEDFRGARTRGELSGEYDWEDGATTRATLLANPNSVGAALSHSFGPLSARTIVKAAYHQAEWRYLEGVVNQGTRDLVGLEHQRAFSQTVQAGLGASLNMYGVRDDNDVVRSVATGGFLRYVLRPTRPLLTASYYLDAEYANRDKRRQASGNKYAPLPIESRAVNSVEIAAGGELAEDLTYVGGAGYSVDAANSRHGPLIVLGLEYYLLEDVGVSVNFRHALASARGDDGQYSEAGLSLVWHGL